LRPAERELREVMQQRDRGKFQQKIARKKTEWKFIPPGSPHATGTYRRPAVKIKLDIGSDQEESLKMKSSPEIEGEYIAKRIRR